MLFFRYRSFTHIRVSTLLGYLLLAISLTDVSAQNVPQSGPAPTYSAEEVQRLIVQLDSDKYSERQKATQQLAKAGIVAVEPLSDAAVASSLEVRFRAMSLLHDQYLSKNENLHKAAKLSLEKLSAGENKGVAKRAVKILELPYYEVPHGFWLGKGEVDLFGGKRRLELGSAGGIVVAGGVVKLGVGSQIVASRDSGGRRIVDVIQGSGLGFLILDGDKREQLEIHVRRIDKKGNEMLYRYLAPNAEALASKHPDIHKIYEKFQGYRGGIVLNGAVAIK